jgi:hypothetical protein
MRIAAAAVRLWTRVYTLGLGPETRRDRLAEIESDLWEFERDEPGRDPGAWMQIAARLMGGIPDDLRWRMECISLERRPGLALATVIAAAATAVVIWISFAAQSPALPSVPVPTFKFGSAAAPPPPPPPPPPRSP